MIKFVEVIPSPVESFSISVTFTHLNKHICYLFNVLLKADLSKLFITSYPCVFITTCYFFHMCQEYFNSSVLTFLHSPKELFCETSFIRFLSK